MSTASIIIMTITLFIIWGGLMCAVKRLPKE